MPEMKVPENPNHWMELEVFVDYDYSPPQLQTQTDPGLESEVTINGVYFRGLWITGSLHEKELEQLADELLEEHESKLQADREAAIEMKGDEYRDKAK